MANHPSHAALPFPIKNARYTVLIPHLDADGDPTDPGTPDLEVSKDDGAAADAAETENGTLRNSVSMHTFSGAELDCSTFSFAAKAATGPKTTLGTLYPRVLGILESGTAQAGGASSITLAAGAIAVDLTGCFVRTTGGTGGGGTGGANNQARVITAYNTSTKVATVSPSWETNPDSTTTYDILLPPSTTAAMLKTLTPVTVGRQIDVDSNNDVDISQAAADKVWSSSTRTLSAFGFSVTVGTNNDKTGYGLSSAAVQAIWDALTSALTTAGSIGKLLVDNINATIGSRSTLDAAGVRSAVGLASANLDTQLSTGVRDAILNRVLATYTTDNTVGDVLRRLDNGAKGLVPFTVGTGSTTTLVETNLTETTNDHYNGRTIVFLTGALAGQAATISDYNGGTKQITTPAMTEAPANGDTAVIV